MSNKWIRVFLVFFLICKSSGSFAQNTELFLGSGFEGELVQIRVNIPGSGDSLVYSDTVVSNDVLGFAQSIKLDLEDDFTMKIMIEGKDTILLKIDQSFFRKKTYVKIDNLSAHQVFVAISNKKYVFY